MNIVRKIPPTIGVLIGVSLYEIANTVLYLIAPLFFPTLITIIGMLTVFFYFRKAKLLNFKGNISIVFSIMIFWAIFMLLRGSLIGNYIPGGPYDTLGLIRRSVLNSFGAMTFFLPLIARIPFNTNDLYYFKKCAFFYCIVSLLMIVLSREQISFGLVSNGMTTIQDVNGDYLSVRALISAAYPGFGFILLGLFCGSYFRSRFTFIFPVAIFVYFISMAIGGGRGDSIFSLLYLLIFLYLLFKYPLVLHGQSMSHSGSFSQRSIAFLLIVGFGAILIYLYNQTEVFDYVLERAFGDKTLSTDIKSESRQILVDSFYKDFNDNPFDWIWGRGVNGSYKCAHLGINGRRAWMEWGYLYLILKGGVVYLFLYVACLLHAAYLGIKKSRNVFSKCLAMICLVLIFDLSSTNAEPQFSTQFVITWVAFGLLEQTKFRMMSDDDVYNAFNTKP